jgi:aspartyl-tRNA(Asn)/glutamyl-tRNA(Gln) amidotransferase subunit C
VSERISQADVVKVARLSRLALGPGDAERYLSQLSGMLEHFADIDALDLDGVEPMTQPLPMANVFREDVLRPSLDRDEVLAAAPASEDGRFRVPPMIGES